MTLPRFPVLLLLVSSLASAAEVTSITITPADPVVLDGTVQRFTATGAFSNGFSAVLGNAGIAAGGTHACSIKTDGRIFCWGQNAAGQFGNGTSGNSSAVPLPVNGIDAATAVAGGFQHTCAVLATTAVRCWGRGTEGQLGNGTNSSSSTPVNVTALGGTTPVAVGAGFQHSCVLLATGGIRCWGINTDGQLGTGNNTASATPLTVSGITTAVGLAVGGVGTCAVLADGGVRCWGANSVGQLGNGTTVPSSVPVAVSGISSAVGVAAGFDTYCAILANGDVRCWGRGLEGQLGNGGATNATTPVTASIVGNAVALALSSGHTCAVIEGGSMQCWGFNGNGQLGNGTIVGNFPTPGPVNSISGAVGVATGFNHTCAILANGQVRCWGIGSNGELGNGTTIARTGNPVNASGRAISVDGGRNHACAVGAAGTVSCWGLNDNFQLGAGPGPYLSPAVVPGINDAVDVAAGGLHTCARTAGGIVRCWGRNVEGQLGNNSTSPAATENPTLPNIQNVVKIAAGDFHTCAISGAGTVSCWGQNSVGQLAYINGINVIVTFPSAVPNLSNAVDIAAGANHTCVALATGVVQCWGAGGSGQLGNGGTANSNVPVTVAGITTATAVSAGFSHSCARLSSSQVQCWGRNLEGQLGTGVATTGSLVPVDAINDANAADVTSGFDHSCIRISSGNVRCWGAGGLGQIGNGAFVNRPDPQSLPDVIPAVVVDAGGNFTCVVLSDGIVRCWGYNLNGELGDGGPTNQASSVAARGINMEAVTLSWTSSGAPVTTITHGGQALVNGTGNAFVFPKYGKLGSIGQLTATLDTDGDAVGDVLDNCINVANPTQCDSDSDGYGNLCDADLNDNGFTNAQDTGLFRAQLGLPSVGPAFNPADYNCNGFVNSQDTVIMRGLLGSPPGPSGQHPL